MPALVVRLKAGQDVTLGLWCDRCMLPSAGRVPIFTVDADVVRAVAVRRRGLLHRARGDVVKTPATRAEARDAIIVAANRHALARYRRARVDVPPAVLRGARQLQQCVCICRRNLLVDAAVLELAGFNAKERRS